MVRRHVPNVLTRFKQLETTTMCVIVSKTRLQINGERINLCVDASINIGCGFKCLVVYICELSPDTMFLNQYDIDSFIFCITMSIRSNNNIVLHI